MPLPLQRSFDDMGAPLADVPFVVLDIETTGGSAKDLGITEIGAVKFVGGRPQGKFHTLVNPGLAIPPFITVLTGITQAMVIAAPPIDDMIPALLEFIGDAVIVGHNVRYDLGYLNAAAEHLGYGPLPNRSVDTLRLARRLVAEETRDMRLGSLARYFRSPVSPTHRALDDARATAHVFFCLLERAGTIGVTHLDDLIALPTARGTADYSKISLTDGLPRRPGVYLFRDRTGGVFYVGKAKNLRTRVRSYFYGDKRRSVRTMLRELDSVEHLVTATELEAEVLELRLIADHRPRHNRRSKPPKSSHYVRLTAEEFPRLSLARMIADKAHFHLGPFRSRRSANIVMEAIWDAAPLRRCRSRPGTRRAPCAPAQLGVSLCPCDGTLRAEEYQPVVDAVRRGVEHDPSALLDPLVDRIRSLAGLRRFEEAAWVRDRHRSLAAALERRRAWTAMQEVGLVRVEGPEGGALVDRGRLEAAWPEGEGPPLLPMTSTRRPREAASTTTEAEEAHLIWRWLVSGGRRVVDASGGLALPVHPVPALTEIAV